MKLYKLCSYLSYRLKYESTYLELKYYLDQVLKNKKDSWVNYTTRYDCGIGKTVSVARLSAKYDIPVFVKNNMCKRFIEEDVPKYLPQYFKKRKRGIGKTVSVARLSAKYDIPVFVKNNMCKRFIEEDVPKYLPQYFKKRKPKAIVVGNEYLKCHRYEVGLIDEPMMLEDIKNIETYYCNKLVGYVRE